MARFVVDAYSKGNWLIGSVLDGVRNEIVENFLDRQTVARNDDSHVWKVERKFRAGLLSQWKKIFDDLARDLADVDR